MIILREKEFAGLFDVASAGKIISKFGTKGSSMTSKPLDLAGGVSKSLENLNRSHTNTEKSKSLEFLDEGKGAKTYGNSKEEKMWKQQAETAKKANEDFAKGIENAGKNNKTTVNQSTNNLFSTETMSSTSTSPFQYNTAENNKMADSKNSLNDPISMSKKKSYVSPTTKEKTGLELAADLKLKPQFNTWDKLGAMGRAFIAGATDQYDYATRNALDRLNENAYRRGMTRALNNYMANKATSTTNTQSY